MHVGQKRSDLTTFCYCIRCVKFWSVSNVIFNTDCQEFHRVFFSSGRYIDYLSLTCATTKNRILKVTL